MARNGEWFLSGPNAEATVYHQSHIKPMIAAMARITGDGQDEYTCTALHTLRLRKSLTSLHQQETVLRVDPDAAA